MRAIVTAVTVHPRAALRAGVGAILRTTGLAMVGVSQNGADAVPLVERLVPELVLVASHLPGEDVGEVVRRLKASRDGVEVLLFQLPCDGYVVRRAKAAGVNGLVFDGQTLDKVLQVIRRFDRDRGCGDAAPAAKRDHDLLAFPALTRCERNVFWLLARGLSDEQVGARLGLSAPRVGQAIGGLLDKLLQMDPAETLTLTLLAWLA